MNVAAQAIVLSDDDDSVDFVDLDSDDDGILEGGVPVKNPNKPQSY